MHISKENENQSCKDWSNEYSIISKLIEGYILGPFLYLDLSRYSLAHTSLDWTSSCKSVRKASRAPHMKAYPRILHKCKYSTSGLLPRENMMGNTISKITFLDDDDDNDYRKC